MTIVLRRAVNTLPFFASLTEVLYVESCTACTGYFVKTPFSAAAAFQMSSFLHLTCNITKNVYSIWVQAHMNVGAACDCKEIDLLSLKLLEITSIL